MTEVLAEDATEKGERLKREGIVIRTFDLWKTYVMGDQVINAVSGVDIEIHRGEYVAIMGPSGSGISTLMNLIGCLDSPTKGEYYINGRLVSSMTDDDLARIRNKEIGFVFQTFNLWKSYVMGDQTINAVSGVDIEIQRGEYVAIMGPSGSGKSTLMNLIGCLDSPTRGLYYLNGNLVSDMQDDELAHIRNKEIGFVFQTFNLLARASGLHNVELPLIYAGVPKEERAERAKAALRAVDLESRMYHRPNELSGGQRQRVAVARALVNNPSILLADEPTGALDSTTGHEIMTLFNRLWQQGNTIVLVTHEADIAMHAHRVIHIRDGKVEKDEKIK